MIECKENITIEEIKDKLDKHILYQEKHEKRQGQILDNLLESDKKLDEFIKKANPVINAFDNISNASDLLSKIIFKTSKIVLAIGVIIGSFYAFKEWINK